MFYHLPLNFEYINQYIYTYSNTGNFTLQEKTFIPYY